MNPTSQGLTPRMRPLSSRKSATLSILDIGTSKVVCLIAELNPAEANERLRGRTHVARIIGIGHQRSLGLKGGAIIDLESAERAIRAAVDAAERMAKVEVQSVIVNLTGGRLGSQHYAGRRRSARRRGRRQRRQARAGGCRDPCDQARQGRAPRAADRLRARRHARRARSARPDRRQALGRHACRRQRGGRRAQRHAGGRALPSRGRGRGRDPLCVGPFRARRRRGRDGRRRGRSRRRHHQPRRLLRRASDACRRDRGRRQPHHHGRGARAFDPRLRGRAAEDAARLLHLQRVRRARHDLGAAGRRRRARHAQPSRQVASGADHQAARRGDPRTGARPAATPPASRPRPGAASC